MEHEDYPLFGNRFEVSLKNKSQNNMEITNDKDTTRVLGKGPGYLRKQMERDSEMKGGMSAVERLAASKPMYVKSPQAVNSTPEPVLSFESASVSSHGSSNQRFNRRPPGKLVTGGNSPVPTVTTHNCSREPDNVVRRSSSKNRRDSILMYREKCDLLKSSTNKRNKPGIVYRLLLGSVQKNSPLPEASNKDSNTAGNDTKHTTPEAHARKCGSATAVSQSGPPLAKMTQQSKAPVQVSAENSNRLVPRVHVVNKPDNRRIDEVKKRSAGVSRSHSDISSRYSKNFADFESFFLYCGLDGEVIESLGKENFSARSDDAEMYIRSTSVSTSEDGFSRNSDDSDGLLEEELHENNRQGTSVVERNARIIKWLYSCKNANETGKKLRELD